MATSSRIYSWPAARLKTNDGNFVDLTQTGSDPNKEDSDNDNWGDHEEISFGSDAQDGNDFPELQLLVTDDVPALGGAVDGWRSNLIVDEGRGYTNETGSTQVIRPTHFRFRVGNVCSRVTPLIVKMNDTNANGDFFDDNDFTVMAIGLPRVANTDYTATGRWLFAFDDADSEFELEDANGSHQRSLMPIQMAVTARKEASSPFTSNSSRHWRKYEWPPRSRS